VATWRLKLEQWQQRGLLTRAPCDESMCKESCSEGTTLDDAASAKDRLSVGASPAHGKGRLIECAHEACTGCIIRQ